MPAAESKRILLVEDDPQLGQEIQLGLGVAGFEVLWIQDGHKAWELDM